MHRKTRHFSLPLAALAGMLLLGLSALSDLSSVARAQGGFGIGIGTGSWYGPGIWGGGGRYNGGGFYGMGFTLSPSHYTSPITRLETSDSKKQKNTVQAGTVEGFIRFCPPQGKPNAQPISGAGSTVPQPAAQPSGPCAAAPAELQQVAILASPYGQNQWTGTQPDTNGHYRMTLMPGGYLIQATNPEVRYDRPVEIIVEPGKTLRHDFMLGPP